MRRPSRHALGVRQVITVTPKPGSFSEEVAQFLKLLASGSLAEELRSSAPRLDRRLREVDRERSAIDTELTESPLGRRVAPATILRRIRTLARAEAQLVFECYWHDLGGEGAA